jgi:hypothetical protein
LVPLACICATNCFTDTSTERPPLVLTAPQPRQLPGRVVVAKGGRVFPHDFVWTGKEYALAYIRAASSVDSTVYLARIAPDGSVLSDAEIAPGLTPRLAFSGGAYGIAYDSYRSGSWDIYFSKADLQGQPIPASELKLGPGSYPHIAWSSAANDWGVLWRNFDSTVATAIFTLARVSASGHVEDSVNVANLPHPSSGFGDVLGLWPKDRGFAGLLTPPTRLIEVDSGHVRDLPLPRSFARLKGPSEGGLREFFEKDHQLRVIHQEDDQLWLADEDGHRRPLLQVPPNTFIQSPTVVQHDGRSLLIWSQHTSAVPNNRLFSCELSDRGCEHPRRVDPDELPQQFVFVVEGPQRLAVLYQAGDYNGAPEIRLAFLP